DPMFMFGIATGAAAGARQLQGTAKRDSPTDPAPALP
ncbi:MAG: hypothetical protein ACI9W4_001690, partial [Rhodothermales bacterium]